MRYPWDRSAFTCFHTAARESPSLSLMASPEHAVGVLTFTMTGAHPHDIASILDSRGICIRAGHHCAQPTMARFGLTATVRPSVSFYNTRDEVDALVAGIHRVFEVFR